MKEILIAVKNKIAMNLGNATYVCDNSDYRVVFDFDEEWAEHPVKTARFKYNGMYQEVVFTGSVCDMPVIRDARLIYIGVYAGNLQTSTPAVVHASQSILSGDAVHTEPEEDVYHQLVELVESGVLQGPPGRDGIDGQDGAPGRDGMDGAPGRDGADGYTPVYGVDYGTPEQIADIANQAAGILADDIKEISDGKVDKVDGKGLSTNDYDNAAKAKVDAIPDDPKYTDTVYDDKEVKQSLNQLKDDLSNKLPKSPANWEPWTAEEQAAARERIGIPGDYELIERFTMTEAGTFERNSELDGTPYNFKKLLVCREYPSTVDVSETSGWSRLYFFNSKGNYINSECGKPSKVNSSNFSLFENDHNISIVKYSRTYGDSSGVVYLCSKPKKGNGWDIEFGNCVRIVCPSPDIEPTGTIVEIYGVRA